MIQTILNTIAGAFSWLLEAGSVRVEDIYGK